MKKGIKIKKRQYPHLQPICPNCRGICKVYKDLLAKEKMELVDKIHDEISKLAIKGKNYSQEMKGAMLFAETMSLLRALKSEEEEDRK